MTKVLMKTKISNQRDKMAMKIRSDLMNILKRKLRNVKNSKLDTSLISLSPYHKSSAVVWIRFAYVAVRIVVKNYKLIESSKLPNRGS